MTRINRVQRLASLCSTTPIPATRTPFLINTRCFASTPCRRAIEPPAREPNAQEAEELYPTDAETSSAQPRSLRLPPKQQIADTEAEIAANDPSYTPATTLADLEAIPPIKSWWRQPGHWDSKNDFSGFGVAARKKIMDPALVKVMLRRAVLEIDALQKTGQYDALKFKRWAVGGQEEMERAMSGDLTPEAAQAMAASLQAEESVDSSDAAAVPTATQAEAAIQAWGKTWMDASLSDESRFVLRKRLYQLTGNLIPDAKLAAARTVKDIATLAAVKPKPTKLYHALQEQAQSQALPPNVKIHGRRITPIDREKAVGRWKVIEKELAKRDLPITGFGDLAPHREKVWMTGKK